MQRARPSGRRRRRCPLLDVGAELTFPRRPSSVCLKRKEAKKSRRSPQGKRSKARSGLNHKGPQARPAPRNHYGRLGDVTTERSGAVRFPANLRAFLAPNSSRPFGQVNKHETPVMSSTVQRSWGASLAFLIRSVFCGLWTRLEKSDQRLGWDRQKFLVNSLVHQIDALFQDLPC